MEELIEALLQEFYFPALPTLAAKEAEIDWEMAKRLIAAMLAEGLIRREDYVEEEFTLETPLVVTKKGLLKANGL